MKTIKVSGFIAVLFAIFLSSCGDERKQNTAVEQPFPTTGDMGAGGSASYLSTFSTAAERTQLRKTLAARTFLIDQENEGHFPNFRKTNRSCINRGSVPIFTDGKGDLRYSPLWKRGVRGDFVKLDY